MQSLFQLLSAWGATIAAAVYPLGRVFNDRARTSTISCSSPTKGYGLHVRMGLSV